MFFSYKDLITLVSGLCLESTNLLFLKSSFGLIDYEREKEKEKNLQKKKRKEEENTIYMFGLIEKGKIRTIFCLAFQYKFCGKIICEGIF